MSIKDCLELMRKYEAVEATMKKFEEFSDTHVDVSHAQNPTKKSQRNGSRKMPYRPTVLCKSNANDNQRISRFVLAIYRRYISETSHGLPNIKTINQRDIGTIFAISHQDIVLARLRCNDISQSKTIIISPRYIVGAKFIVTICCSELPFNNLS